MPADLDAVKPIYKTFKGWNNSVGVREFDALPADAQAFVKIIEEISKTKVGIISTSPERDDTIIL
jgi:adenylosuccinate synthase